MSWFREQLIQRKNKDQEVLKNAFYGLASVVVGKSAMADALAQSSKRTHEELSKICGYFRVKAREILPGVEGLNDQIDYVMQPSGILNRKIKLTGTWWKDGMGPLLCASKEGEVLALIPGKFGGYHFFDTTQKKEVKVRAKEAGKLMEEALCFYRPFPSKTLNFGEILGFIFAEISALDILFTILAAFFVSLLGLVFPLVNQFIFSTVITTGKNILLVSVSILLVGLTTATFLLTVTKTLIIARIETKMSVTLQSAIMGRLIHLPASFFKAYGSGDLAQRLEVSKQFCIILCEGVIGFGLTAIFSIFYVVQIFALTPTLAIPALLTLLAQLLVVALGVRMKLRCVRKELNAKNDVNALIYAIYSGIQKIKLSGSERRVFSKWAQKYEHQADASYNHPLFLKVQKMLIPTIAILGNMLIYYAMVNSGQSVASFMAFHAAFVVVSGAIFGLSNMSHVITYIHPIFEMMKPILDTLPEAKVSKKRIQNLRGHIELDQVSFQYGEGGPKILDGLNLKIKSGEYVAIVGKSGCGKSTLLRLLLGFEKPQMGAIYYDGMDMEKVDLQSLRRSIGVVMQNGGLFAGDIYSNITISAPWLSLSEAWEAAEMAGFAEDIRRMPMQMHTIISDGGGGISGGQKQRIMIARAIAPKPKVLMFDEATSALDNITQKQVSAALAGLKSTRIVIAHRLSTVTQCDRIIVLDGGKIKESGTYEELIKKEGFFADLVKRQQW